MIKQLSVRLHGEPVGILSQHTDGKLSFEYDVNASQAISLSMPLDQQKYGHINCEVFFGGLLPESETARKLIGKRFGVNHHTTFALLKAIGHECAGAISLHEVNDPISAQQSFPLSGKILKSAELYQHIKSLPTHPLFIGIEDLRLSLAGVQDKAAICLINDQIAIPTNECPTTHILKPAAGFPGMVENEYFCLKLAAGIGLPVPHVELRIIKDFRFLLIERYDRHIQVDQVERIHQEDFCQALAIVTSKKYQNEGGPSLADCFNLLTQTTQPAIDRNLLAKILVFNFLIGNRDAHGKNFSLLYKAPGIIRLAPFYDLICTQVYPQLTSKMAMKVASQYDAKKVLARHWETCCIEIGYSYPALKKLFFEQSETILKVAKNVRSDLVAEHGKLAIIDNIMIFIEKQIAQTIHQLNPPTFLSS